MAVQSAQISELRQYTDPKTPSAGHKVILPTTSIDAVFDQESGDSVRDMLGGANGAAGVQKYIQETVLEFLKGSNDPDSPAYQLFWLMAPSGFMGPWPSLTNLPPNTVLCDGRALNRVTYKFLFNIIGTTFGAGNGSTTFNVPNIVDRTIVGCNANLGYSFGNSTVKLLINQMPRHGHNFEGHNGWETTDVLGSAGGHYTERPGANKGAGTVLQNPYCSIEQTGGGEAHDNIQPSLAVPYIIKT